MSVEAVYADEASIVIKHRGSVELRDKQNNCLKAASEQTYCGVSFTTYTTKYVGEEVQLVDERGQNRAINFDAVIIGVDLTDNSPIYRYNIGSDVVLLYTDSKETGIVSAPPSQLYASANSILPPQRLSGLCCLPVNQPDMRILDENSLTVASFTLTESQDREEFSFTHDGKERFFRAFWYHYGALAVDSQRISRVSSVKITASTRKYFVSGLENRYLAIGHRGCGSCKKHKLSQASVSENTLYSHQLAFQNGADYVETDCILTKDAKVVINHDFSVRVPAGKAVVCQLTEQQFKEINLIENNDFSVYPRVAANRRCTMAELLTYLDPECGINLEIKYPAPACTLVGNKYFARTTVVTTILQELQQAYPRPIYFSSFDLPICWILSVVYNKYPVFYLHASSFIKLPCDDINYAFPEARHFGAGLLAAQNIGLPGMVLSKKDVRDNAAALREAKNLAFFSYGTERKDLQWIREQQEIGISGIIMDMIDY